MRQLLFSMLLFVTSGIFCQEKVSMSDADKAFALIFSNPKKAKSTLDKLEIRAKTQNDSLYSIILNNKGVYYAVQTEMDSAFYFFNKSSALADKAGKRYLGTQNNIAVIYKKNGEIDKAIALLRANLLVANEKNFNAVRATIYGELASCYAAKEWYKQSLENVLQSIEIWGNENPIPIAKIAIEKQKLGNLYVKMGKRSQALKIFYEISPIFKKTSDFYNFYLIQITIANIYLELDQSKEALSLIRNALPSLKQFNDKELLHFAFDIEAKSIENSGNKELAQQKYTFAVAFGLKHSQIKTVYTLTQAGNLLLQLKDTVALQKLEKQTKTPLFKKLLGLSAAEDQMGYYMWMENYAKSVNDKTTAQESKEKAAHLEFLVKEKHNLQQVKEFQNKGILDISEKGERFNAGKLELLQTRIFIAGLLLLIGLLITFLFYKNSKNKQAIEQLNLDNLALENKLAKQLIQQEKQFCNQEKEITHRQERELLTNSLKKIESKALLRSATQETEKPTYKKDLLHPETFASKALHLKTIVEKFKSINPFFFSILQTTYPALTKGEIAFCCLIRLNFSNKEIAHLMQINTESVITKKYRIVKKLHLSKEVDFHKWLAEMS